MEKLILQYSFSQIVTFLIIFGLAIKGLITFFDWAFPKIKSYIYKTDQPEKMKEKIKDNSEQIEEIRGSLASLTKMVQLLIESDKDAIKAYITQKNLFFVHQQGWIDNYSLDCIQRRYGHYKEEGGNSFVNNLMNELRELPRKP